MTGLAARALRGWLFFQFFLALLLFLPAGTFAYPEARAYWLVFGFATAAHTIYFLRRNPALVERRMSVGPGAEKRLFQKILQAIIGVTLCIFYIVAGLDYRFHWSTVPLSAVVLGDALVLLSFLAMLAVFRHNSFASATVELQPEQRVATTGPYAIVRHPLYSSAVLLFVGSALALASYWAVIIAIVLVGLMAARLLDEERFLRSNLAGYDEYCGQVRYRLLPRVW